MDQRRHSHHSTRPSNQYPDSIGNKPGYPDSIGNGLIDPIGPTGESTSRPPTPDIDYVERARQAELDRQREREEAQRHREALEQVRRTSVQQAQDEVYQLAQQYKERQKQSEALRQQAQEDAKKLLNVPLPPFVDPGPYNGKSNTKPLTPTGDNPARQNLTYDESAKRGSSRPDLSLDRNVPLSVPLANPVKGSFGFLNERVQKTGQGDGRLGQRIGSFHHGIDITAPEGTEVAPTRDGKIVDIGWGIDPKTKRPDTKSGAGSGWRVIIEHHDDKGNVFYSKYSHLRQDEIPFRVGQSVTTKDVIGHVGRTGNVPKKAQAHLHLEVYRQQGPRTDLVPNIPPMAPLRILAGNRDSVSEDVKNDIRSMLESRIKTDAPSIVRP